MTTRRSALHLLVGSLVLGVSVGGVRGEDAAFKVGLASVKITPETPVYLAGYASRSKPFESVAHDLYAKVLLLEDARGERAVLVTADLLGFRAEFAEPLCAAIGERTGLRREQILLNASHTHSGPYLTLDPEAVFSAMTAEDGRKSAEYTQQMVKLVAGAVVSAGEELQPATLSTGTGIANFVMNRREFTPNGVRLGVNPRGLADRSVPVLKVASPEGRLLAVLFGVACHNTTLGPRDYVVSGDFAGYAQAELERMHAGAQAMFMAGCGGSANPYPRGGDAIALEHGKVLAAEVDRVLETADRAVSGPLTVAFREVALPLETPPSRAELDQLASGRGGWRPRTARKMIELLERGEPLPGHYRAPVAVWQFGDDLTLVGLPGEVVVDYVPLLELALGPLELWISAYCNDNFGYIPSADVLREGGYETRGVIYNGVGIFSPKVESVLVNAVAGLAKQAGRTLADR